MLVRVPALTLSGGVLGVYDLISLVMVAVQSLTHVQLFATPWTVTCQAPLSMGFPRFGLVKFICSVISDSL